MSISHLSQHIDVTDCVVTRHHYTAEWSVNTDWPSKSHLWGRNRNSSAKDRSGLRDVFLCRQRKQNNLTIKWYAMWQNMETISSEDVWVATGCCQQTVAICKRFQKVREYGSNKKAMCGSQSTFSWKKASILCQCA